MLMRHARRKQIISSIKESAMRRYIPPLLNISLLFSFVVFILLPGCAVFELHKISVNDLNKQLDSTELVILDVRPASDWQKSEFKIRGAIHEDPFHVASWADKYPRDSKIILYCA